MRLTEAQGEQSWGYFGAQTAGLITSSNGASNHIFFDTS